MIDENNIYEYNREYKNLRYCIIKDIINIKKINFESPKMKLLVNNDNNLKVNIKKCDNYYKEINNDNIKKIIRELYDENLQFINEFEDRFNKIIEKYKEKGIFNKEYFDKVIFKEFFKKYQIYLKYEYINIFKELIYENIDEDIQNHKFNEKILGFKEYYIAYEYFLINYIINLSCYNFNYINNIKNNIINFINIKNTNYFFENIIKSKKKED